MLLLTEAFISDPEHIEGGDMLSTEQLLLHIYLAEYKLHTTTKIKKEKKKRNLTKSPLLVFLVKDTDNPEITGWPLCYSKHVSYSSQDCTYYLLKLKQNCT